MYKVKLGDLRMSIFKINSTNLKNDQFHDLPQTTLNLFTNFFDTIDISC